jgi:prephenate dehydratase
MVRVAFQGERGAFSEDAAVKLLGTDVACLPCAQLKQAFEIVSEDEIEFGVVPVENSEAGSINDTYDLLLASPPSIYMLKLFSE